METGINIGLCGVLDLNIKPSMNSQALTPK
jgi:hypothetical protein